MSRHRREGDVRIILDEASSGVIRAAQMIFFRNPPNTGGPKRESDSLVPRLSLQRG